MRYGLLISVLLITVLSVSAGVAISIGRHRRLPDRVTMLHFDQCAPPCWIGIVPGKTPRSEAIQTFTSYYKTMPDYAVRKIQTGYFEIAHISDPTKKYRVSFSSNNSNNKGIVKSIDFELFDELTIADLSILLGTPRYFVLQHIADGGDAIMYGEKDYGVMLFLMPYRRTSSSVSWEIRLRNMSLFGKDGHFRANSRYVFLPWQSWRTYQYGSAQR
jgi:hypothetical protein